MDCLVMNRLVSRKRFALALLAIIGLCAGLTATTHAREPVRLIFDTDMGNDIDDALALAMIHILVDRGECELLAVTITKDNRYSAPFVDLVNTFYGRKHVPVGVVRNGVTPKDSAYTRELVLAKDNSRSRYPHALRDGQDAPEAVALLRKVLANQPDGSVAMVQVGFSTNYARLLDSKPDNASPLDGKELVGRKARLLSMMAGGFSEELRGKRYGEYNVKNDLAACQKLAAEWPTPVAWSGYEIGKAILFSAQCIENDFGYVKQHPIREAYGYYMKMPYDRPTWDLTSVLYAVRPDHGYFDLSPPGRVIVEQNAETKFEPDPNGKHRYLKVNAEQIIRVKTTQEVLCSQPPRRK
jgi:inosine-uridine nucleoside N-ribohydrolase